MKPQLAPAIVVRYGPGTARGRRSTVGHAVIAILCLVWFLAGVAVTGSVIAKLVFALVGT